MLPFFRSQDDHTISYKEADKSSIYSVSCDVSPCVFEVSPGQPGDRYEVYVSTKSKNRESDPFTIQGNTSENIL